MKKIALFITLIGLAVNIYAQNVNIDVATERNLMSKTASKKIIADGSPYIEDNFAAIKIEQFDDQVFTARYNAYNDEMEVRLADGKIIALDNNADYTVKFIANNKVYKTSSYITENDAARRGFLVVLKQTDDYTLLKREQVKFYKKVAAASSYQQDKPANFKREDDSYLVQLDGNILNISQKKKTFIKAFPKHSSKLKTYIKKNKINLKKEEDLIETVAYLSTL